MIVRLKIQIKDCMISSLKIQNQVINISIYEYPVIESHLTFTF